MGTERPRFEVADVVRRYGDDYRRAYPPSAAQDKVLRHIAACRTGVLGGHVDQCIQCGLVRISYNSCRDRHCPKCQGPQRAEWLEQRLQRLLPVPYFHVVFTLPAEINPLALRNKRVIYRLLFQAASKTLLQLADDPKHLGAQIGVTAVLHTWGQNLMLHPHLHCVVTGGGLSADGTQWVPGHQSYFLPVKVLGKLFRGKFLDALHRAWTKDELALDGSTAELAHPRTWKAFKNLLYRKDWVVYAKRPFGGPQQVFDYLGRYTHRVAISNHRIVNLSDGNVTFTLKDYKHGGAKKTMTLDAVEFLRRFLLHVLPKGFVRIRHYGLYASRNVNIKLVAARQLLQPDRSDTASSTDPDDGTPLEPWWERFHKRTGVDVMICPSCGGQLFVKQILPTPTCPITLSAPARASPEVA